MTLKSLPYENVDFFVDDVERENAESVLLFNRSGGTVLEEGALRHLRENLGHRVRPVFRLHFRVSQNVATVGQELAAEEKVGKVDLEQYDRISFCTFVINVIANLTDWVSCDLRITNYIPFPKKIFQFLIKIVNFLASVLCS